MQPSTHDKNPEIVILLVKLAHELDFLKFVFTLNSQFILHFVIQSEPELISDCVHFRKE